MTTKNEISFLIVPAVTSSLVLAVGWIVLADFSFARLVVYSLAILLFLYVQYAFSVYRTWKQRFAAGKRVSRKVEFSPSHQRNPPNLRLSTKRHVLEAAAKRPQQYANKQTSLMHIFKTEQEKAPRRRRRSPGVGSTIRDSFSGLDQGTANELNMDHIFVPFWDFLWANTFVGPNALLLLIKGMTVLMLRQALARLGWIKMKEFDPACVAAKLCLEGTLAMYYRVRDDSKDRAAFYFPECPIILPDGSFAIKDILAVDIDLKEKRLIRARLDDQELTPSQAVIVLWFKNISDNHAKLHAYANWGVNVETEQVRNNPFHARNSLVTVMYNYYGVNSFVTFFPLWKKLGLLSDCWDAESLSQTFRHGVMTQVPSHTRVDELMPHSTLVNFLVKVRAIFLSEFSKRNNERLFPGVDGEAMFIGTILHSLDHVSMEWNLADPLWLDIHDTQYGLMAELGRIVRVGFVEDVPGLYFQRRFRECDGRRRRHEALLFYQAVYEKAAKINKNLADHMDTCICK